MNSNYKKGLVLIELIAVVTALNALSIGMITSIGVLSGLEQARVRGVDASVRSTINNMRPQADMFFDMRRGYSGLCSSPAFIEAAASINDVAGARAWVCNDSRDAYAISGRLGVGMARFYCVDSRDVAIERASPLGPGITRCSQ